MGAVTRFGVQLPNFSGFDPADLFDHVAGLVTTAEEAGFDSVWVMDHFYQLPALGGGSQPMLESYTLLGALAASTTRVRLGTLVTGVTYRNPAMLPEGAVLVVGSGQSGCQIAEDLHLAGRKVFLCVGDAPRVARRYRGKDVVEWLHLMGYYDLPVHEHPLREGVRDKTNHYVTGRDGGN